MTRIGRPTVMRATLRDRVVRSGKWAVAQALHGTGLLAARRRVALRQSAVVLAYHRLIPAGTETWSHPGIIVTPETFERHMRLLKREFRLLTLDEFEQRLSTGTPFEPGSCLVTFDDGWTDTYAVAWPILQRLEVPAVIFLPTHYIGSHETFWQEHLGMLLYEAGKALRDEPSFRTELVEALRPCGLEPFVDLLDEEKCFIVERVRGLKLDAQAAPSDATARLAALLGPRAPQPGVDRFMTWDQVREMARGGMAFGAHGHTHRILSRASDEDIAMELETARVIIERELGTTVTSVSYPNGGWNDLVATCARSLRFRVGFSMERGHAMADDPSFAIRRMNVHEGVSGSDALFRARILGVL